MHDTMEIGYAIQERMNEAGLDLPDSVIEHLPTDKALETFSMFYDDNEVQQ